MARLRTGIGGVLVLDADGLTKLAKDMARLTQEPGRAKADRVMAVRI